MGDAVEVAQGTEGMEKQAAQLSLFDCDCLHDMCLTRREHARQV